MSTEDVTALIARIEQEERDLVFRSFTHADAWRLGCLLVELATERSHAVTIDIRRGEQQLFHAALEGSVADFDTWVERKARVVRRFGASSFLVGLRSRARGTTFTQHHDLPFQQYAAFGGSFPVRVERAGIVGTVTVSGLAQVDDHDLVVEAVRTFLA